MSQYRANFPVEIFTNDITKNWQVTFQTNVEILLFIFCVQNVKLYSLIHAISDEVMFLDKMVFGVIVTEINIILTIH